METMNIAVDCDNCDKTSGYLDLRGDSGRVRCDDCGRFAARTDEYCAEHDVHLENLPSGYAECPYCAEKSRIEDMRQERAARRADPRMHPSVDARRF